VYPGHKYLYAESAFYFVQLLMEVKERVRLLSEPAELEKKNGFVPEIRHIQKF